MDFGDQNEHEKKTKKKNWRIAGSHWQARGPGIWQSKLTSSAPRFVGGPRAPGLGYVQEDKLRPWL